MTDHDAAMIAAWGEIESFTRDRAGVNRMMDLVAASLGDAPVEVERVPGRDGLGDTLVVRAGPRTNRPQVLVLSHLDTVHPPGTAATTLPVKRDGDKLYGPGVYDMKGGAYLALQAFLDTARAEAFRVPATFLFTPDEEIGSPTTRGLIEDEARRAQAALVTEPARDGGKIVTARKAVGIFHVEVEGVPAHAGARHERGRSAIRAAARLVLELEAMTDYAKGITTNVGTIRGGSAGNVVPQRCSFEVDLRAVTPEDAQAAERAILGLRSAEPDIAVRVTGGLNRPAFPPKPDTMALFERAAALAAEDGWTLDHIPLTGGGSDGNFTAAVGCPTLDGLGIDGDGAHTLNEYALLPSVAPRRKLMARLLQSFA
jgi:glutamate carboxypeptidase